MCHMKEQVQIVDDSKLGAPWLAATSEAGQRVVFVRQSDEPLLDHYCAAGPGKCPVYSALQRQAPALA